MLFLVVISFGLIGYSVGSFIYRDAKRRGHNNAIGWAFAVFIGLLFGVVLGLLIWAIYLTVRNEKQSQTATS